MVVLGDVLKFGVVPVGAPSTVLNVVEGLLASVVLIGTFSLFPFIIILMMRSTFIELLVKTFLFNRSTRLGCCFGSKLGGSGLDEGGVGGVGSDGGN